MIPPVPAAVADAPASDAVGGDPDDSGDDSSDSDDASDGEDTDEEDENVDIDG